MNQDLYDQDREGLIRGLIFGSVVNLIIVALITAVALFVAYLIKPAKAEELTFDPKSDRTSIEFIETAMRTQYCLQGTVRSLLYMGVRNRNELTAKAGIICLPVFAPFAFSHGATQDDVAESMTWMAGRAVDAYK